MAEIMREGGKAVRNGVEMEDERRSCDDDAWDKRTQE